MVLLSVTSQGKTSPFYGDLVITEWEKAGLIKPSVIKPVIATIHKKLILRRRGKLEDIDLKALKAVLGEISAPSENEL